MKPNTIRIPAILLAVLLAFPLSQAGFAHNYPTSRTYQDNFSDVPATEWFYPYVAGAYELGLINGKTDTAFRPGESVNLAETIKLASICHVLLTEGSSRTLTETGKNWYDAYVAYAKKHNIVTEDYPNYLASASRAQVAVLFSRAITDSGVTIKEINTIEADTLKDIPAGLWYGSAVFKMYRWGILTGDGMGYIHPESKVKRSEIAAIVMRIIDEACRVTVGESSGTPATPTPSSPSVPSEKDNPDPPTPENPTKDDTPFTNVLLHRGQAAAKSFTGVTFLGAEFTVMGGGTICNASYQLDLARDLTLEKDNLSFRLYTGEGLEAFGIVRGWLNEAARGKNGSTIREATEVYDAINELFFLVVNGQRIRITELWYTDHGSYVTYAFYFDPAKLPANPESVVLLCGKGDDTVLRNNGLTTLADLLAAPDDVPSSGNTPTINKTDAYHAALDDAKSTAKSVLFEHENTRCTILYGSGLYGRDASEYRLIFIFRDGTTQTIATQKLASIRMNNDGNVLYYSMTGPDGLAIQYGINFD